MTKLIKKYQQGNKYNSNNQSSQKVYKLPEIVINGEQVKNYYFVDDVNDPKYIDYQNRLNAYNNYNKVYNEYKKLKSNSENSAKDYYKNNDLLEKYYYYKNNNNLKLAKYYDDLYTKDNYKVDAQMKKDDNLYSSFKYNLYASKQVFDENDSNSKNNVLKRLKVKPDGYEVLDWVTHDGWKLTIPKYNKPTTKFFVKGTPEYDYAKKQEELRNIGAYKGEIDGKWESQSQEAEEKHKAYLIRRAEIDKKNTEKINTVLNKKNAASKSTTPKMYTSTNYRKTTSGRTVPSLIERGISASGYEKTYVIEHPDGKKEVYLPEEWERKNNMDRFNKKEYDKTN